ncbi:DUF2442 domain-containing protein [Candidatus Binatia bacterium]|nr:DUF2442 domain-containing protein [Candidatus Binatia bacterium]
MSLAARRARNYPAIVDVRVSPDQLTAKLSDGREVSVPLAWFSRLLDATPEQLGNFEISPGGYGIHWPEIDEDISVKAFLD